MRGDKVYKKFMFEKPDINDAIEYISSHEDECVKETIIANEYEFLKI